MPLVRLAALCFLVWSACSLGAPPGGMLRFDRLTIEDGLAQNTVWDVLQDPRGYMWLATEEGLHRFDGYEFEVFRADPDDPHSLSESYITTLFVDRDGVLWIGTLGGGLNRMAFGTGQFERVASGEDGLSSDNIWALAQDEAGAIWVGTDEGLNRLDPATGAVERFLPENSGLRHRQIWALEPDSRGRLWIGTHRGLDYLDPATGLIHHYESVDETAAGYFSGSSVNAFWEDDDGTLWVGTEGALVQLDRQREVQRVYEGPAGDDPELPHGSVWAIRRDRRGELWVGTFGGGLLRLDAESETFVAHRHSAADPTSLGSDYLYTIFEDRTGVLWLATMSGGASLFDPTTRVFTHYKHRPGDPDSLPSAVVWGMEQAHDGRLWVVTNAGLSSIDRASGQYQHFKPSLDNDAAFVGTYGVSVHEDRDRRLWVGTDYGLHRLDRQTSTFEHTWIEVEGSEEVELYLNTIQDITDGTGGDLWLGTAAGIIRYEPGSGQSKRYHEGLEGSGLSSDVVVTLYRASDGVLWAGTDEGLAWFDEPRDRFQMHAASARLSHEVVQSIREGPDGHLWLGTANGLDRLDLETGRVRNFDVSDGLPNNVVYAVLADGNERLWLSTNQGLSRLNVRSLTFKNYDVDDGLQSNEFNLGAHLKGRDGELFFGGINGMTAFYPEAVRDNPVPPEVRITRFEVLSEPVELQTGDSDILVLEHWQDVLSFEFAAFDFAAPSKNQFRYRLEGFDADWRQSGSRNHVTYTNLDPGNYRFEVLGANNDGVWSTQPASVEFHVSPPLWKTWWAYAGYALGSLLVIGQIVLAQRRRVARSLQLKSEREKSAWANSLKNLTAAMSSSLHAEEVVEQLFAHLRRMMPYDQGVVGMKAGRSFDLIGSRGLNESEEKLIGRLPTSDPDLMRRVFADGVVTVMAGSGINNQGLTLKGEACEYLAVPLLSRSEDSFLLLIGRAYASFSEEERDIVAAFANQAIAALDNARLFSEVQSMATTDSLTGMNNRRHFLELAELEFSRMQRYDRPASLLLIDADHFKTINDTWGHEEGDRALEAIALIFRNGLRQIDISGRFGGEEFIVMLPETELDVASEVAERLRHAIEHIDLRAQGEPIALTVSIGVAATGCDTRDLKHLIRMADDALYRAKREGRNRISIAKSDTAFD